MEGHLNREKGFGNINYNIIRELSRLGLNVLVDSPPGQRTEKWPEFCKAAEPGDLNHSLILVTSQNQNEIRRGYRGRQIIYTAIDGSMLDPSLVAIKDEVDEIWLPSNHSLNAARRKIDHRFLIVPYGVDFGIFDPERAIRESIRKRSKFTFVTVCRWTWRKGPELLIEVFSETFKPSEVDLVMVSVVREFPPLPSVPQNVFITNRLLNHEELFCLYSSCHAFVLPNRGEARGLPQTEAGALGLPVIATRWGGQTEYLNDSNSFPIEIDGLVSPPPETGKEKNNLFANPSKESLKEKLRHVYENYSTALEKAKKLQADLKEYTWKVPAEIVFRRLKGLMIEVSS